MIAMTLIILMVLYVVLFFIVGFKTDRWSTRLFGWGILLAPLIWKTWDIPIGYYRFQKMCEAEAGFKVNVPDPAPARIIRLGSYSSSFSAERAEIILRERPSVQAVEAGDRKYHFLSKPMAFALYERASDGAIVSRLMDKLGTAPRRGDIHVLESAPSNADYIFTETRDYLPTDRITRERQELRDKNGTVIGSSTSLSYMWSNPANTLFYSSYHTDRCGPPMATSDNEYNKLLDLIAPRTK